MRTSVFCSLRAARALAVTEYQVERRRTLAGLEDEGNTVPPLVLDVGNQSTEGGTARLLRHSVILQVSRLAAVERPAVLTDDDVLGLDCIHRAQNTDLLVTDVLGGERDRALHGEQGQHLQKIYSSQYHTYRLSGERHTVLHDITDDAELVKVTTTALGAERLLECDLDR